MLRKEFPFKISVAGCSSVSISKILHNYQVKQSRNHVSRPQYEMKLDINNVSVRLHLKQLLLENRFTTSRLRDFQGSIGMIYIFEKNKSECFNEVKIDYLIFEDLYKTVEIQPNFLSVDTGEEKGITAQILEELSKLKITNQILELKENNSFAQIIKSILSKSKTFQSTTQGSCDINLE